jgi:hypothetical protein
VFQSQHNHYFGESQGIDFHNFRAMAATTQFRIRGRPAHTAGPTYLSYTPDGTKLVTVGSNNTTRVYKTGFDGEPTNIDYCQEQNMGVAANVRRSYYHFMCTKKQLLIHIIE